MRPSRVADGTTPHCGTAALVSSDLLGHIDSEAVSANPLKGGDAKPPV
jgi:hypothetical protein